MIVHNIPHHSEAEREVPRGGGYASYDDFCRVFKRRVGSSVRKWTLGANETKISSMAKWAMFVPGLSRLASPARRKAFHGWAQAVIRAISGAVGTIRVTAASRDLVPASLPVEARLPFAPQGGDSILYEEV